MHHAPPFETKRRTIGHFCERFHGFRPFKDTNGARQLWLRLPINRGSRCRSDETRRMIGPMGGIGCETLHAMRTQTRTKLVDQLRAFLLQGHDNARPGVLRGVQLFHMKRSKAHQVKAKAAIKWVFIAPFSGGLDAFAQQ